MKLRHGNIFSRVYLYVCLRDIPVQGSDPVLRLEMFKFVHYELQTVPIFKKNSKIFCKFWQENSI